MPSDRVPGLLVVVRRYAGHGAAVAIIVCWATVLLLWPLPARAQLNLQPYATGTYEYNSNIAAVAPGDPAGVLAGDPHRDDRIKRAAAGVTAKYQWSQQVLSASAEGRHYAYDHFSRLDHDEYLLSAKLDWKLATSVDGKVDVSRERRMADLKARLTSALVLETESDAAGSVNFHIGPDWRLETGAKRRDLDSPQPGFPGYGLRETTGDAAIKYAGPADWTFGVASERVTGDYHGGALAPSYRQTSYDGTASYGTGEPTLLKAAIGYTKRENPALNAAGISATTGLVSYGRKLTGKTSVSLGYQRAVNSYVIAAASEVDSTVTLKADWEATTKISVLLGYTKTGSSFTGETVPFSNVARSDQYQATNLDINYAIRRWLSIGSYAMYQTRSSNITFFGYNGAVVGVQVKLQRL